MKNFPTRPDFDRQDDVILNSTVNVPKAIDGLYPYERIHCILDNDETGYKATQAITLEYTYRAVSYTHLDVYKRQIIKRTHIYINFSDEKECIFFARTSVDRVERLRQ